MRWLLEKKYTTGPEGLPGNDDYGIYNTIVWYNYYGEISSKNYKQVLVYFYMERSVVCVIQER